MKMEERVDKAALWKAHRRFSRSCVEAARELRLFGEAWRHGQELIWIDRDYRLSLNQASQENKRG